MNECDAMKELTVQQPSMSGIECNQTNKQTLVYKEGQAQSILTWETLNSSFVSLNLSNDCLNDDAEQEPEEYQMGVLLNLKQKFHNTFASLEFLTVAIEEMFAQRLGIVQVCYNG